MPQYLRDALRTGEPMQPEVHYEWFAEHVIARRSADGLPVPGSCLAIGPCTGAAGVTSLLLAFVGPWPARVWERYQPAASASVVVSSAEEAHALARYLATRGLFFNDTTDWSTHAS